MQQSNWASCVLIQHPPTTPSSCTSLPLLPLPLAPRPPYPPRLLSPATPVTFSACLLISCVDACHVCVVCDVIRAEGRICLDILNMPPKGAWKPSLNLPTILASIGLLLAQPNPDDGLVTDIVRRGVGGRMGGRE